MGGCSGILVDLVGIEHEAFSRRERSREPAAEIPSEARGFSSVNVW
jgi:hypothetical protein